MSLSGFTGKKFVPEWGRDGKLTCAGAAITSARLATMFLANVTEFTNLPVPILSASVTRLNNSYKSRNSKFDSNLAGSPVSSLEF